jgi:formylglycine-generating enzyme required for sulfatase activity
MAADAKHIPILCIDVQGFTTHNTETQRTIVRRLQRMATDAARFFMPFGDPWTKWQRHGTGDGYYFPFDALSPQVALQYALNLEAALTAHNAQHGQDLVLRLYGVLVLGDVELVGDQYLSAAFSEAARFLSHQPFKDYLDHQERSMVLAMSSLFHTEWRDDIERENIFPEAATLQWTPFRFRDKHGDEHQGYVLGPGWEQETAGHAESADSFMRYYQDCVTRWSDDRYALDKRFVQLTLLLDQGEDAAGTRWQSASATFSDLKEVLEKVTEQAVVVLGPPGSGKSTLLRHFELDGARAALAEQCGDDLSQAPLTFFVPLNDYKPDRANNLLPPPQNWLAEQWAAHNPTLPALDILLRERRLTLLLDALNEIPASGPEPVRLWKEFLRELARDYPGNRVIFSCRHLDYSVSLSSKEQPVPQVRIELLSDAQVQEFVTLNCPEHGERLWQNLQGTPQLEVLRSPYYLKLLIAQTTTGDIPVGRAALFTGFVRQALQREVAGDNVLFQAGELLHARDVQRLNQVRVWRTPFELPERGMLIPKLSALAFEMQTQRTATEAAQVRVTYDEALAMLDHPRATDMLKAGAALGVLEEDLGRDEVLYVHQLLQEYFAARHLARAPQAELVHQEWRADRVVPDLQAILRDLADADPLPPLPSTGWEETTVLAAAMNASPERFVTDLIAQNLPLAGRCAAQPEVLISEALKEQVRWALVHRTQDASADLRARIAAGLALGEVGDPRFKRQQGPYGAYLLPPLIEIPGGTYRIGSDEGLYENEAPVHGVTLTPFAMAQFPVTNAEWALFMQAGGYEEECWWETEGARAWRCGKGTAEGPKQQWWEDRQYLQENFDSIRQWHQEGRITSKQAEDWEETARMSDEAFEAQLAEWYPDGRQTQPANWNDETFKNPAQPVVGICWFEAWAYCAWLSAQTGESFRLPTEAEWEAAARGRRRRRYAFGEDFDATRCNTFETHIRRTTPIGVFPGGETPEGLVDMTGNTWDWTSSLYKPYPYDAADGREESAISSARRVVRGGACSGAQVSARASYRYDGDAAVRDANLGLRVVRSSPRLF